MTSETPQKYGVLSGIATESIRNFLNENELIDYYTNGLEIRLEENRIRLKEIAANAGIEHPDFEES